jgi:1,4-alpha-glucan branching enzyme
MGSEFGQWREWNHDRGLDWDLLNYPEHQALHLWVQDLNHFYRNTPALYELDFDTKGFQWIDCNDSYRSILSFLRFGKNEGEAVAFVCNFTPVPRHNYRIGVPWSGRWKEVLNSDSQFYGGSGMGNLGEVEAEAMPAHGRDFSLNLILPPLAIVVLKGSRFNAEAAKDAEKNK